MKYLVFILALIIAIPTVQAGACGMGDVRDAVEQLSTDDHDCCPGGGGEPAEPETPCEDGNHCGACVTVSSALPATLLLLASVRPDASFDFTAEPVAPSHSIPPFRPPIS